MNFNSLFFSEYQPKDPLTRLARANKGPGDKPDTLYDPDGDPQDLGVDTGH